MSEVQIQEPSEILSPSHKSVLQVFHKLRSNPKFKRALRQSMKPLKELDCHGTKCVVIYIKSYVLNAAKKFLPLLKPEIERILCKQRKIIPKPPKRSALAKVFRPKKRTITALHESMLEDLIFPSEIMGKRTLYRPNSGKLVKVFLDLEKRDLFEGRLRCLSMIYKKIAHMDAVFEFPLYDCPMRVLNNITKTNEKQ